MIASPCYNGGVSSKEERSMADGYQEYVTFHVTAKDGSDVEMAVMDEFEFEKEHYVAAARVIGDTVDEEGIFIYKAVLQGDDFSVEKIRREFDYRRIAEAYMNMDTDEAEE